MSVLGALERLEKYALRVGEKGDIIEIVLLKINKKEARVLCHLVR